jgi:hypothetical protein
MQRNWNKEQKKLMIITATKWEPTQNRKVLQAEYKE